VITIFPHRNGQTEQAASIDRAWLDPASGALRWVDLAAPSVPESLVLSETFGFHPPHMADGFSRRDDDTRRTRRRGFVKSRR